MPSFPLLSATDSRFRALLADLPQLVWTADLTGSRTWSSESWTAFTGLSDEASRGSGWLTAVAREDREHVAQAWRQIERGLGFEFEAHFVSARGGPARAFRTRLLPIRDADDKLIEWLGISSEVQEIAAPSAGRRHAIQESRRRARNILATIRSVARRTAVTAESVETFATDLDGRINALARTQSLMRDPLVGVDVEELIMESLRTFMAPRDTRIRMSGTPVRIGIDTADALSLALHELATNALKFGAFSRSDARLDVSWQLEPRTPLPHLVISWIESGVPLTPGPPRRHGFGMELLEKSLKYELEAEVAIDLTSTGLRLRLSLPHVQAAEDDPAAAR